jgi:hypothetical protein
MSEQDVFNALKYRIDVDARGTRRYYNSAGQLHRTNGPAVEWSDGTKSWYQYDIRHRTDGAAIEYANGYKRWFIHGVEMHEAEFNQAISQTKCLK